MLINQCRLNHIRVAEAIRAEYERILNILDSYSIEYVLIKYPHLVPKFINDLDLLVDNKLYKLCCRILGEEGYYAVYTEQEGEEYKTVMKKYISGVGFSTFHIHREVAWNSVIILSGEQILSRRILANGLKLPSPEDELIISIAHILFETGKIKEYDYKTIKLLINSYKLDQIYIKKTLKKFGWEKSFNNLLDIIQRIKGGHFPVQISWTLQISALFSRLASYQFFSSSKAYIRYMWKRLKKKLNPWNRGMVVALIGCDGVGKSTVSIELSRLCNQMNGPTFEPVYIGWRKAVLPTSLLLKGIVKITKRTLKNRYSPMRTKKRSLVVSEIVIFMNIVEYMAQWILRIFPKVVQNINVVTDRYFYDLLINYRESNRSIIFRLFFKFLPKPDFIFLLDCDLKILAKRTSEYSLLELKELRQMYLELARQLKAIVIETNRVPYLVVHEIISNLWEQTPSHQLHRWHPVR